MGRVLKLAGGWAVVALIYYALWKFPRLAFVREAVVSLPEWVGLAGTVVWFASVIAGLIIAVWPQRWRSPPADLVIASWAGALLLVPFALYYVSEEAPENVAIVFMVLFFAVLLGDKFVVLYVERRRRQGEERQAPHS